MINERYSSLENLIQRGVGSTAEEVCANLIGKVDKIGNPDSSEGGTWDDIPQVRITAARLQHHPNSMHPNYIHVDAEEV